MSVYRKSKIAGEYISILLVISIFSAATLGQHQSLAVATHEQVLTVDPERTKVHWTVDSALHLVHGTFAVKSGQVHFDPGTGKAGGEIIVLTTSGESGNTSRDERMHKEILESSKYPDAIFRPEKIDGKVSLGGTSDVQLLGTISLHGSDHPMTVPVHVEISADHWTGIAKFAIPYVQWGIKDPSKWMLKVKPIVNMELDMTGSAKRNE